MKNLQNGLWKIEVEFESYFSNGVMVLNDNIMLGGNGEFILSGRLVCVGADETFTGAIKFIRNNPDSILLGFHGTNMVNVIIEKVETTIARFCFYCHLEAATQVKIMIKGELKVDS